MKQEIIDYRNLINGKIVSSSSASTMNAINPSTGNVWARIPLSTIKDGEESVNAARSAFSSWSRLSGSDRASYLTKAGKLIAEYGQELAELQTMDNGWVISNNSSGASSILTQIWNDAAGKAMGGNRGETIQTTPSSLGYTLREPYGVVLGILPWNAPLFTFTIKAAYALAAGNTVIIKPSEEAAVAVLRCAEILNEVFPSGVVNVVSGTGKELGDSLVKHQGIDKISMTGSGGTASAISYSIAKNPKPLILELGGKSPNIIFSDADLEKAVSGVIYSVFTKNAGQICVAGSRILVQKSIFEEVVSRIKHHVESNIKHGDPMNPESGMGPIANASQYEKIRSYINQGIEEGAEIVVGGQSGGEELLAGQPEYADGYWIEPTLFRVNSNSLAICKEEIFGPVASIMSFETEEEAVAIANDTSYGLAAGVWTTNIGRAHRMVQELEAGNVWVNTYARVGTDLPFGGQKSSGYGTDDFLEYTREKACVIEIG